MSKKEGWPDFWIRGQKIDVIKMVQSVPPGIIRNGDFETGDLTAWTSSQASVVEDAYAGSYACRLEVGGHVRQTITGVRVDELIVTLVAKALSGTQTLEISIMGLGTYETTYTVSVGTAWKHIVWRPAETWEALTLQLRNPTDSTDAIIIDDVKAYVKLKPTVYQAEKDRTISNFPSEYPLPSTQISDLKDVSVNNFPSEYPLPSTQISDLKDVSVSNFPSEYPLPSTQVSDLKDVSVNNLPTEYPLPSTQVSDLKNVSISREGAYTPFSASFSAAGVQTVYTPSSGKKARVLAWSLYNTEDVRVELRFASSGNVIAGLPGKGASAMNLIGLAPPTGDTDETVEIAAWGATTVKGWICVTEV